MITLTKHHGIGNDFLVCDISQVGLDAPWAALAVQWCDRRLGIGADGLLLLGIASATELTMVLHNADGSRAEMSGNGIRCLAQAAYIAQGHTGNVQYAVHTDAGLRAVSVHPVDSVTVQASVSMGAVAPIDQPSGWATIGVDPARPVMHLSLGNPHTVVGVDDVAAVDLLALGTKIPQVNLEIVEAGPEVNAITMRAHERGVGITQACGTGACASAWAAAQWALVTPYDGEVIVHMDGGDATVRLNEPEQGHVTLVGSAVFVAQIQIHY